jgi:dGTPase
MERFGDSFDHNRHALRIVESFEQRYARFPGLNLTFEVREGVVKHSRDLVPGEQPELDSYLPQLRPTLEAQLIDLADEVAYNTADLDDGFSAGLFPIEDLAASVPEYAKIQDAVETQFPGATGRERFYESLRQLIDLLVSGLIEGTAGRARESGVRDAEEVRSVPYRLAAFTAQAAAASRELKQFLYRTVYVSPLLTEDRKRSMSLVSDLFQFFCRCPERLPESYCERTRSEAVHRVVCDYIAGMTDAFFMRTFEAMIVHPAAGAGAILPRS